MRRTVERLVEGVVAAGWQHWAWVVGLTVLGMLLGHRLADTTFLIDVRYRLHQYLTELGSRPLDVRHTAVVTVTDEDYWQGELAGRRPIKRDYLARLLLAVDEANPAVVALDFDLSAPNPASPVVPPDYRRETADLIEAIRRVATHRPVVLPRTIGFDADRRYVLEADIHDSWRFCPALPSAPSVANVLCGYIALPYDVRLLPPVLRMASGLRVDSFSLAVTRARRPIMIDDGNPIAITYGSFLPVDRYEARSALVTAGAILDHPNERSKLRHRVVLIGGAWSSQASGRGPIVDGHPSPVGVIPGVFVHANYVEAILDGRTYRPIPTWFAFGVEGMFVLAAALLFIVDVSPRRRGLMLGLLAAGLVLLWYLMFQNFGRFFDGLIPLLLVTTHAGLEQVNRWRHDANHAGMAGSA